MSADGSVQRWQAPELLAPASVAPPARPGPTLAQLEEIDRAAHEEGFARGHAEGFAQGQADARRLAAQIAGLLDAFSRPLDALDHELQQALCELAVHVAGALVEREYRAEPALLAEFVTRSVELAAQGARSIEVRLHPEDLDALVPLLGGLDARLKADASLARGDVRVHSDALRLDGTLASRLQSVLAQINLQEVSA
jgi:flagellar assembly protein FliH